MHIAYKTNFKFYLSMRQRNWMEKEREKNSAVCITARYEFKKELACVGRIPVDWNSPEKSIQYDMMGKMHSRCIKALGIPVQRKLNHKNRFLNFRAHNVWEIGNPSADSGFGWHKINEYAISVKPVEDTAKPFPQHFPFISPKMLSYRSIIIECVFQVFFINWKRSKLGM